MRVLMTYVKQWYLRYERWLIPGALVAGVLVDFVTFRSVNLATTFAILGGHLLLATFALIGINRFATQIATGKLTAWMSMISPLLLQFSFGALLSASLIFYWFSGTVSVSWPLIGVVAVLMVSNEILRHYFVRPVVQLAVWTFIVFSLGTLIFPYVLHSIDVEVFVLSGVVSLIVAGLYLYLFSRWFSGVRTKRVQALVAILCVYAGMNALYFFHVIPPIPLSLREAGVYESVVRTGNTYQLEREPQSWWQQWLPEQTVHLEPGQSLFVYSSVYAPTEFSTTITHRWEYYDEGSKKWVEKDQLSFSLTGGREEGYRGYSKKTALQAGRWRVWIQTPRKQILGRVVFRVERPLP